MGLGWSNFRHTGHMVVEGKTGQMAVKAFGPSMAAASTCSSVHVYTDCALVGVRHLNPLISSSFEQI